MKLEAIKDSKTESQEKNYMFNRIDISSKGKNLRCGMSKPELLP